MRPLFLQDGALNSTGNIPNSFFNLNQPLPSKYPLHLIQTINIDECKCQLKSGIVIEQMHALNLLISTRWKDYDMILCILDEMLSYPLHTWEPIQDLPECPLQPKEQVFAACGILLRNATLDVNVQTKLVKKCAFWEVLHLLCCFGCKDQRKDAYSIISSVATNITADMILDKGILSIDIVKIFFMTLIDGLGQFSWTCIHSLVRITAFYENHLALLSCSEPYITAFIEYCAKHIPSIDDVQIKKVANLIQQRGRQPGDIPEEWCIWELSLMCLGNMVQWESSVISTMIIKSNGSQFTKSLVVVCEWSTGFKGSILSLEEKMRHQFLQLLHPSIMEHIHIMSLRSIHLLKVLLETYPATKNRLIYFEQRMLSLSTYSRASVFDELYKMVEIGSKTIRIGSYAAECLNLL